MKRIIVKISIFVVGVLLLILVGSFFSRVFIHKHIENEIDDGVSRETPSEVIQINILNSTIVQGIADRARDYMRERGFDVVEIGNYSSIMPRSIVIDRVGDFASALKVAKALGISDSLVFTKKDSTLFLRVSIILGTDYNKLKSFR